MPVNTQHADYKKFLQKWERVRDACAGEDAVHGATTRYLPKLKEQSGNDYAAYVSRTPFYNATWRTVSGLVGMVFRKPPRLDGPVALTGKAPDDDGQGGEPGLFDDVDGAGKPFQLLAAEVAEEALKFLRVGVLVDYPESPDGLTAADALALNLLPTMQLYDTFSIINWKFGKVDNKRVPVQVVLAESAYVATDEFEGASEDRWRVLDLVDVASELQGEGPRKAYRQRLFRLEKSATRSTAAKFAQVGGDIYPKRAGKTLGFIPFRVIGVDDSGFQVDDPPLLDLVNTNFSHYRTSADLEHGCHFTALPTLVLTGWKRENPNDKVYLGGEAALVTPNDKANAHFVEFTGAGLAALEKNLDRKEAQMAVLGARMLEPQKAAVETAQTESIHRKGEESLLSSIAQSISLGLTDVAQWFAEWAALDRAGVRVTLNRDFYPVSMTPQMLTALVSAWQMGVPGLSDQGIFAQLQKGEVVDGDVTLEDEQARIKTRAAELAAQQAELYPAADAGAGAGAPAGAAAQQ